MLITQRSDGPETGATDKTAECVIGTRHLEYRERRYTAVLEEITNPSHTASLGLPLAGRVDPSSGTYSVRLKRPGAKIQYSSLGQQVVSFNVISS